MICNIVVLVLQCEQNRFLDAIEKCKTERMWFAKMNQRHRVFGDCAEINDLNDPVAQAQHIMIDINICMQTCHRQSRFHEYHQN